MLAIAVRYLTGRVVATDVSSRERAEWPPHPGRLFMALVAAWGAGGRADNERRALEWLERQGPPSLAFPDHFAVAALQTFVPVNDPKIVWPPESRDRVGKAGRYFPSVIPAGDRVHFIWATVEVPADLLPPLQALCARMTYLGHSRTLVHAYLEDSPPEPRLVPTGGAAEVRVRVAAEGRLDQLEAEFLAERRPSGGAWHGYGRPASQPHPAPGGHFQGDFLVLKRLSGPRLGLGSTLKLCLSLRAALQAVSEQPVPEVLSGHRADGSPSVRPHLAIVPLADVGHQHAEGSVLGLALLVPKEVTDSERAVVTLAASRVETLHLGRTGVWRVSSASPDDDERVALRASTWTSKAKRWATVTPVVLDRFPKADGDAEAIIANALRLAGLPEPANVVASSVSMFEGAPHAREFTALESKTGSRRWHCHAVITFPVDVEGPVLCGAGRFRGYGFFRPLRSEEWT